MKKIYLAALAAAMPALALAQSAIDAQQISQSDFKGTARFMAMGGAFTALGGDLSTLNQNPGGIGIYRSNDVGVTLDINFQHTSTSPSYSPQFASKNSQTKVYCNNFGYIGATNLSGAMRTFNWGVTYNRAATFDRVYRGYVPQTQTSLSNYIASFTTAAGYTPGELNFGSSYDPYYDSNCDWLSILGYSSYLINEIGANSYVGLSQSGTVGDALFNVRETGYVDEYNISFGGNVENVVYWGAGIGITDLNYTRTISYSESMENALIPASNGSLVDGNAGFDLASRKYINGSGWNIKLGVIIKPVNELRIGLAVHTPTWYNLNQGYDGSVSYSYFNPAAAESQNNPMAGYEYTDNAYFDWHYRSPWKLMAGLAGVIGGKAIVSFDYQYDGYGDMSISTPVYYSEWGAPDFQANEVLNQDIKDYFKASNTFRVGFEYRVTPQFSLRAGYNVQTTNVRKEAEIGSIEVLTSGVDASYTFRKSTQHITCGLGYKYKQWYIDAAYVYTNRENRFHAFTDFDSFSAPQVKMSDNNSSIVLSTGFRF